MGETGAQSQLGQAPGPQNLVGQVVALTSITLVFFGVCIVLLLVTYTVQFKRLEG